jgi:hypothetical protein
MKIISGLAFAGFICGIVDAFTTGAGSCKAGTDAILVPGLPHATNSQVGGTALADFGITVALNGELLNTTAPTDFMTGDNHTLTITATDAPFLGFLARIDGSGDDMFLDTTLALASNSTDVQVALSTCINVNRVGGVTHTDSNEKESVSAVLRMDDPADGLLLDVTVVIRNVNSEAVSEWYFSRFGLNAVGPPTTSPTVMPTTMDTPMAMDTPIPATRNSAGFSKTAIMGTAVACLGAVIHMI